MCELRCGVDRGGAERGVCGLGTETYCFKRYMSFAEEVELLPAYMVYFGACNYRCRFCIQGPDCFAPSSGERIEPVAFARVLEEAVDQGAKTISLLGGEPSLHLHTILEIAAAARQPLPLVLKTNMHMTSEALELLDGVIQLYLADFKFGNDRCARSLAGIERYFEPVSRNLKLAAERTPVLIRHLLMPGHIECCLRPVAQWIARELPSADFHLMTGYVPAWRAAADATIGRTVRRDEIAQAELCLEELGLMGRENVRVS